MHDTYRGTVVDDQGKPVANQRLTFMGAYDLDYSTITDAAGASIPFEEKSILPSKQWSMLASRRRSAQI